MGSPADLQDNPVENPIDSSEIQPKASAENETAEVEPEQHQELPPIPFVIRVLIFGLTSYFAEKVWRYRGVYTRQWYSDEMSSKQKVMIEIFEYFAVMGVLFVMGIVVSKGTVLLQHHYFNPDS